MKKKYIFPSIFVIFGLALIYGVFAHAHSKNDLNVVKVTSTHIENDLDVVKDTPVRIGTSGVAHASLVKSYDLDSAFDDSDLVADITITSWIGEEKDVLETYFNAKVNAIFKGDTIENIVLLQNGNSEITLKNYPLFKIGDRMLLFLVKAVGIDCDNPYCITGSYSTVMDIQIIDNVTYVIDRIGLLTEPFITDSCENPVMAITPVSEIIEDKLSLQMESFDPILSKVLDIHDNVFSYDDIVETLGILSE